MVIQLLKQTELEQALELIWNVFREYEAPEYEAKGIHTFQEFIRLENITEHFKTGKMRFLGAFQNDEIVGVLATRNRNHISLFFVNPEFHKQGIGKALFRELAVSCREENVNFITVNSSPYAVNIYHKLGFADTDQEQTEDGIRFTPMKCELVP